MAGKDITTTRRRSHGHKAQRISGFILGTVLGCMLAPYAANAAPIGVPWTADCATSQPGPFSIWINEIHYIASPGTVSQAVEIAAMMSAKIDYQHIDLAVVTGDGVSVLRVGLTTCEAIQAVGAAPLLVDVFVCRNTIPLSATFQASIYMV
jgi:hypothetical protein